MTYLSVNGSTKLYGIIGNPVNHSFSPEMQTRAFQYHKLNSVYLPFPIQEHDLPRLLDAFKLIGMQGFNVTVPYKERIVKFLPELSEEAEFIGAVNTVKRTHKGWKGFCTDETGFALSLEAQKITIKNKRVLLLGAGGAAKAIAFALSQQKVRQLRIINRSEENALDLKTKLLNIDNSLDVAVNTDVENEFDLLINTTSVGMKGDECPIGEDLIKKCKNVVDIIYNPPITPLLKVAEKSGIRNFNGIDMLLYQGVAAFEIWTEMAAPVEIMRESLKNSLAIVK